MEIFNILSSSELVSIKCHVRDGSGRDSNSCEIRALFSSPYDEWVYPGSLNLEPVSPIKFNNYQINLNDGGGRIIVPAQIEGIRVFISHIYPLREPLYGSLRVFSNVKLRDKLNLISGDLVNLEIPKKCIDSISLSDSLKYCIKSKLKLIKYFIKRYIFTYR